jgi:hypothetical protein
MTDPDQDGRVARAYGDLGREEPPAALDAAILAAARRRRVRWHAPAAAAAALVLAVGVALVVQREAPRKPVEIAMSPQVIPAPAPPAAPAAEREQAAARAAPGKPVSGLAPGAKTEGRVARAPAAEPAPDPRRERMAEASKPADEARAAAPAPAAPAPPSERVVLPSGGGSVKDGYVVGESSVPLGATSGRSDRADPGAADDRSAPAVAGALRSAPAKAAESPEDWLERIAKLREAGRGDEADESLAAFRRRYPDYEIPKPLRARVLPR